MTPLTHMTPLTADEVARGVVDAVRRGQCRPTEGRVVMPRRANSLLLGEALSPRIGDFIATALSKRRVASLLGLNRGPTYHQAIG
jgi:hypothetical protein